MLELLPIINNEHCLYECILSVDNLELNIGDYFPRGYNFIVKVKIIDNRNIIECSFQNIVCKFDKIVNNDSTISYYIYCNDVQTCPQIIDIETT